MLRKTLALVVTLGLLVAAASGCGTVRATSEGILRPYAGANLDSYIIGHPQSSTLEKIAAGVDYPFSLGGDLLLMVFTIPAGGDLISGGLHQ